MRVLHHTFQIPTHQHFEVLNLTPMIETWLSNQSLQSGQLIVTGQHTTTALSINEHEERLLVDIQTFFEKLVPAGDRYLHNDLHLRDVPDDEPINAHSHLMAMLLDTSLILPVIDGSLGLGTYQSLLMLELDGPRQRRVLCQFMGE